MPDLQRFVSAQTDTYDRALAEIASGRKRSHWMWFVFPQLRGLGRSPTATHYGIDDLAEAQAYLDDAVLGSRLREITQALLRQPERDAHRVFGSPDDLKLRSSMTLFERASSTTADARLFASVLKEFYGGERDRVTLQLLDR